MKKKKKIIEPRHLENTSNSNLQTSEMKVSLVLGKQSKLVIKLRVLGKQRPLVYKPKILWKKYQTTKKQSKLSNVTAF